MVSDPPSLPRAVIYPVCSVHRGTPAGTGSSVRSDHVLVVATVEVGPLLLAELPAVRRDLRQFLEVGLARGAGGKQDQHRRRPLRIAERVDPARRHEEEVAGCGADPALALVEADGAGQDEKRLGHRAVEVRARAAWLASHVPSVEPVLPTGG